MNVLHKDIPRCRAYNEETQVETGRHPIDLRQSIDR